MSIGLVVEDETIFRKFFPKATRGDLVQLKKTDNAVAITFDHETVTLSTAAVAQ